MSVLDLVAATDYSYSTSTSSSGDAAAAAGMTVVLLIAFLVIYVITGFLLYKVFQKAGRPGWAGFVPVYNLWVLFEISGKPGWWALFVLIPYLGGIVILVLSLLASLELAKRFGKGTAFGVFGLWLFSIIGYAILAFDSSTYQAGAGGAPSTPAVVNTPPQGPANEGQNTSTTTQPPQDTPPTNLVQ